MSTLAWFEGKVGEEYETARWVHEQNSARIAEGNVVAFAEQVAALFGPKGVFCGTMLAGFLGKQEVLNDALDELRAMIRTMPDEVCERVFAVVEKTRLPIHISNRRIQYEANKMDFDDAIVAELRRRIATCSAQELVTETATIVRSRSRPIFGIKLAGTSFAWSELMEAGLARIRELLPTLPDDEALDVIASLRANPLPRIDSLAQERAIYARRHRTMLANDGIDEPRSPELEAAIASDLDDPTAYAVLGDFLEREGHPRGELIALQLRAEKAEPSLAAEARAHLDAHARELLGSLAAYQQTNGNKPEPALIWRRGYIDRLRVALAIHPHVPASSAQLLESALHHPAGRFIRAVELLIDSRRDNMRDALEVLVRSPHAVTELVLGSLPPTLDPTAFPTLDDVGLVWSIPTLRTVAIFGNAELGAIDHDGLETVTFAANDAYEDACESIAHARLPRVRRLEVWLRSEDDPAYNRDSVRHLLSRGDLPSLTHLGLCEAQFADDICTTLGSSPLARQLRMLDLSRGSMSDAGARILANNASALPALDQLVVSHNNLSEAGLAVLRGAFRNVVSAEQLEAAGDDEDDDDD